MLFSSILIGVCFAFFAICADAMIQGKRYEFVSLGTGGFVLLGALIGLINGFAPTAPSPWPIVFLAALLATYAGLTYWCIREVGTWKEWFMFFFMGIILYFPTMAVAARLGTIVTIVTQMLMTAASSVWLINLLFFKSKVSEHKLLYKVLAWIAVVALVVSEVLFAVQLVKSLTPEEVIPETTTEAPAPTPVKAQWYKFYNQYNLPLNERDKNEIYADDIIYKVDELEYDEDAVFNFAPNPYHPDLTAEDYAIIHKQIYLVDPAAGAMTMCWIDKHLGTRFMGGMFYDQYEFDDVAVNAAKDAYMADEELYHSTINNFLDFMTKACKRVEVVEIKEGIKDQAYMNPYGPTPNVPDVCVWESGEQGGHFLVYTFVIKGRAVMVGFRIECGFQPINCTEKMKVSPQNSSQKPSGGGGKPTTTPTSSGGGKPTTKPTTGGGQPLYPITNPKDPTKGTDVGPNDTPGPGPYTGGGDYSSEEEDTNTGPSGMNNDQYDDWMDELGDINDNQRTGGDDNKPSYTPPGGADSTDSNAGSGTGNGGVDDPTPTSPAETTGGESIANDSEDTAAGAWYPDSDVSNGADVSVFESEATAENSEYGGGDYGGNG